MADTAALDIAAPKKTKIASKKPSPKPSHPKTSDMVNNAIKNLKERGGSSLQAIKKYIASNYKVDAEKLAPFIRKHLKSALASGALVQTKGRGASGSFKLAKKETDKPKPATKKAAPKGAAFSDKKPQATAMPKKPAVKKPKSPAKAKTKAPAAKKPKPKKAVAKMSSPKKDAPKK